MNNLHPHWQTTDEDEQPVRITDKSVRTRVQPVKSTQRQRVPRAKRGPAAFIGIALFLGAGFALFQGANGLLGQISPTDVTIIRITENGIDPAVVTVQPGKMIRWNNESSIPHIFESDTLPTSDGQPFMTTAIFPNGFYEYVIPENSPSATHNYESKTSIGVKGQIIIDSGDAIGSDNTPPSEQYIPPAAPIPDTPDYTDPAPVTTTPDYTNDPPVGGIPQNPNSISDGNTYIPPRPQPGSGTPMANTQGNINQHLPSTNTSTGMEVWVTLAIAGFSLAYVARKSTQGF